ITMPRIGRGPPPEKPAGRNPEALKVLSPVPLELSRATHGAFTPSTLTKSPAIIILPLPSTTGSAQSPQPGPPKGLDPQVIVTEAKFGSRAPFGSSRTTP